MKGSRLFLCDSGFEGETLPAAALETTKIYEKIGQPMTIRTLDTLKQLIQPWNVREPGFLPLEEWFGIKARLFEETRKVEGVMVSFQGAILEK